MLHLLFYLNDLAIAAISTAATRTAIAARTAATARTSTTMPSSAAATPSAISAMRPIASWTLRPSCCYSLTVCIFAIKIRFAAFIIVEVAAAFKGDSLFAFSARLRMRTLAALAARAFP